jgi:2-octaprenyl-6-methoxyphenol hydroxylase
MGEQTTDFDIILVGGGMTGATLALALAQAGFRLAVIDEAPLETRLALVFDGRASAIAFANFRQWRALGVGEALAAQAQVMTDILITDGPNPGAARTAPLPVFLHFDADEIADRTDGDPLGWMVENRHIRAVLNAALAETDATLISPATLADVTPAKTFTTITLGDSRRLTARLVIGADGKASRVRKVAGIGVRGWAYPQAGVVATLQLDTPHNGVAHQYFLPGGPLAILPLTENRASLVWSEDKGRAEALAAAAPEAFEAHLARRFGDMLGRPRLIGPRYAYPLRLQIAESLVGARTALVGDAGHVIHPIAGQGLNLGLKDTAALAQVLIEAARLGEDFGSDLVLERYANWRRFDGASLALTTDLLMRVFSSDAPPLRVARDLGLAVVNRLPAFRRVFMQEAGGAMGDLPKLLKGERL